MSKFVNVEHVVVVKQAETAGVCGGFLLGASVGAKVGSNVFWWLGPVAAPVAFVGSIFIGGVVGAVGGGNFGSVVASQLDA